MSLIIDASCRNKDHCDRCGLEMRASHSWCTSQKCYCSDACYLHKY
ncbi:MAG: hypothetical protein AB1351_03410 [Thermoproteota archaeon]